MSERTSPTADEVREFILARLESHLAARGLEPAELDDSFDLLIEGVIDSFGIVELVMQLEERFGFEVDFSGLDADDLTRIGPLSRHVEAQGRLDGAATG
jgi:acyl carrier protein